MKKILLLILLFCGLVASCQPVISGKYHSDTLVIYWDIENPVKDAGLLDSELAFYKRGDSSLLRISYSNVSCELYAKSFKSSAFDVDKVIYNFEAYDKVGTKLNLALQFLYPTNELSAVGVLSNNKTLLVFLIKEKVSLVPLFPDKL